MRKYFGKGEKYRRETKVARSRKIAIGIVLVVHWSVQKWCDRGGPTSFVVARALRYRVTTSSRVRVTVPAVLGRRYARPGRVQRKWFGAWFSPPCFHAIRVTREVATYRCDVTATSSSPVALLPPISNSVTVSVLYDCWPWMLVCPLFDRSRNRRLLARWRVSLQTVEKCVYSIFIERKKTDCGFRTSSSRRQLLTSRRPPLTAYYYCKLLYLNTL